MQIEIPAFLGTESTISSIKLWRMLILFAVIKFVLHILTIGNYGYNNDELYAIAMSKHLDWGYVDLPPLVPALIALTRLVFGESLYVMHIIPAFTGAVTVIVTGLMVKELGGKMYAICLTLLVAVTAPTLLAFNSFYGYDGFDQLMLAIFFLILIKLVKTRNLKLWLLLGLSAGLCLLTKATLLFYGPGVLLALFLCGCGKDFKTKWPYLAFGIMMILQVPNLLWQVFHDFQTISYWFAYKDDGTKHLMPISYLLSLIFVMNPLLLPLSVVGVIRIIKKRAQKGLEKLLGIAMLVSLVLIYILNGKNTMLVAFFVPLFAHGAIHLEEKLAQKKKIKLAVTVYISIASILFVPMALPLVSPETFIAITGQFMQKTIQLDNNEQGELPAHFANCHGWDNMAKTVSEVYYSLPEEDQDKCAIFASDYDQAGAIDLHGPQFGLMKGAISGRLTYYLWGYGDFNGEIMLSIGLDEDYLRRIFREVSVGGVIKSRYAMPQDTNLPVFICRGLMMDVKDFWEENKNY